MNNSALTIENVMEVKSSKILSYLKERETFLVKVLEAIGELKKSEAWGKLSSEVFEGITERLERNLKDEAKKVPANTAVLANIAGQLSWAEKYSDLQKMEQSFFAELTSVREHLKQ